MGKSSTLRHLCAGTAAVRSRSTYAVIAIASLAVGCGQKTEREPSALPEARGPLLGVVSWQGGRSGAVARLDPRTLRPVSARKVKLRGYYHGWSLSPRRDRLAVGVSLRGRLQVVDLRRWRSLGLIHVGRRGDALGPIAWGSDRRVTVLVESFPDMTWTLAVIDPLTRRVLKRTPLQGDVVAGQPSRLGLVLLLAPRRSIGASRLVWATAQGNLHSIPLPRTTAGSVPPSGDLRRAPVSRHALPGLAVDEERGKAFIVSAGPLEVAEVDLAGRTVKYHELDWRVSLLGRLRDALEPAAEAKGASLGATRSARWLGGGLIALTGLDERPPVEGVRGPEEVVRPFGLRLIDTSAWTIRTLDSRSSSALAVADALVVANEIYVPVTDKTHATGLVAYSPDGRRLFHLFGQQIVPRLQAAGHYAYASFYQPRHRTYVIDLRSGRIVHRLRTAEPPQLLVR
jgi:hypothetical protein